MSPKLDKSWETFHLEPNHDMLICNVQPCDTVRIINVWHFEFVVNVDWMSDVCFINRDLGTIRLDCHLVGISKMILCNETAREGSLPCIEGSVLI